VHRRAVLKLWAVSGLAGALPYLANAAFKDAGAESSDNQDSRASDRLPAPHHGRIPVAFLLSADAQVVDFAGPWGVFQYVSVPGLDEPPFQLYTVAESAAPLKVSGGMTVVPNYTLAQAPQPKVIVVPAQGMPTEAMLSWLK